jgi:hypothetical protein
MTNYQLFCLVLMVQLLSPVMVTLDFYPQPFNIYTQNECDVFLFGRVTRPLRGGGIGDQGENDGSELRMLILDRLTSLSVEQLKVLSSVRGFIPAPNSPRTEAALKYVVG